jgi:acetyltransferase-like isoleucine patch superfamily enzyme
MKYSEGQNSFFTRKELDQLGFGSLGKNVLISRKASVYNPASIFLADNVRIDDFCCLSGMIRIGRNAHIAAFCLIAGGETGISVGDFCTFAYRVSIFCQSDDYLGLSMVNSTVPPQFKNEKKQAISISSHVIVGASSTIMPGAHLAEGTAVGACSLVIKPTQPWGIYFGAPAKRRKDRSQEILEVVKLFKASELAHSQSVDS